MMGHCASQRSSRQSSQRPLRQLRGVSLRSTLVTLTILASSLSVASSLHAQDAAPADAVPVAEFVGEAAEFAVGEVADEVQVFEAPAAIAEVQVLPVDGAEVVEVIQLEAADAAVAVDFEAVVPQALINDVGIRAVAAAAPIAKEDVLIGKASDGWKYWDTGTAPGNWRKADFDDAKWKTGKAPLGYGDDHITTKISFGEKDNNKHLVSFFRRTIKIENADDWPHLVGSVLCDDAAAVFVNSKQVFRHNLPDGRLTLKTRASQAAAGATEQQFHDFVIPPGTFKEGVNVIAVRVHQVNRTSSDLGFDLEIHRVKQERWAAVKAKVRREQLQREAAAAGVAAQVQAPVRVALRRSFIHVSDGNVTYIDQNGARRTQRNDCVTQATSYVPGAAFIRVLEGDTLAKIAAQRSVPVETLAKLNRTTTTKVFDQPSVLATKWLHQVQANETLEQLATGYNTTTLILKEINPKLFTDRDEVKEGDMLTVPGEYTYHFRQGGNSYLRLGRYNNNVRRQTPYNPRSQKTRRKKAKQVQTLAEFAKAQKLDGEFLAKMNGLKEDAKLKEGQWVVVEYSVELAVGASAQELANFFNVELALLLDVNGLDDAADVDDGQRVQVPIGNRLNQRRTTSSPVAANKNEVVDIVLGAAGQATTEDAGE